MDRQVPSVLTVVLLALACAFPLTVRIAGQAKPEPPEVGAAETRKDLEVLALKAQLTEATKQVSALQAAIGAADDGDWGPASRLAAGKMSESDIILRLLALRLKFMTKLKNWPSAGRGWANRIADNLLYGAEDS